jgi:hypothetical protein
MASYSSTNSRHFVSRVEIDIMGIAPLDPVSVEKFVSEYDPGHNKIVKNQEAIDAFNKLSETARTGKTEPAPEFAHDPSSTFWHIGSLDSILMSALSDDLTSIGEGGGLVIRSAESDVLAARLALKGWDNFATKFETETIKLKGFDYEGVSREAIKMIPLPILRDIGRRAKAANTLDGIKAKNSA